MMQTITAAHSPGKYRALLVGQGGYDGAVQTKDGTEPTGTVTANTNMGQWRGLLVDSKTSKTGTSRRDNRAMYGHGRVVAMTPRAIARFQTFPDWYELPEEKRLATRGIGNAVPCLLAEKILKGMQP